MYVLYVSAIPSSVQGRLSQGTCTYASALIAEVQMIGSQVMLGSLLEKPLLRAIMVTVFHILLCMAGIHPAGSTVPACNLSHLWHLFGSKPLCP